MSESDNSRSSILRREFLRRGVAGGLAIGLPSVTAAAPPPVVKGKRTLGRTGIEVSDIGFGGSLLGNNEDIVRYAVDRGVTYFDTAEDYTGGRSEEILGRALKGVRDEVVITSKLKTGVRESKTSLMGRLEGCLRRLQTDRIDIFMQHAVNDVDRLRNPEWGEFTEEATRQGKIRFRGMSGHAGHLVECIDYGLDHDLIDVMLVAHNFGQDPAFLERFTAGTSFVATQSDLPRVLRKAKQKQVGVIAMKTLMGARKNDMKAFEIGSASFSRAAMRWILSLPDTDALAITMRYRTEVDEYLSASGWRAEPTREDVRILERYFAANTASQCRYGCKSCADACPSEVPISEVLRTRMYARDYGDEELARREYRALGKGASACLSCSERECAGACPFGLRIEDWAEDTHRRLSSDG